MTEIEKEKERMKTYSIKLKPSMVKELQKFADKKEMTWSGAARVLLTLQLKKGKK